MQLACKLCQSQFTPKSSRQLFCKTKCTQLFHGRSDRHLGYQRAWYATKINQQRARGVRRTTKLKAEMIAAYSPTKSCACCGETALPFLTIDHINRDGKQDRQAFGGSHRLWSSLRKRGWPNLGYRILCMNCNFATRYGRACPHEELITVVA